MQYPILDQYITNLLNESVPEKPLWNMEMIRQGKKPHWNYIDGCMMNSLWRLFIKTGDKKYGAFVDNFMDYYINDDGLPLGYDLKTYNLDNICPGQILYDLYQETGREKYKKAIDLLMKQLSEQPRTHEGNFWHKQIYPNQVWLDGLYMAQVFYTKAALEMGREDFLTDIKNQFATVRKRMYVPEKRLYCHGYDASKQIFWADPESGKSPGFWLRAMGWYTVALADIIEMTKGAMREEFCALFTELIEGIKGYRDQESCLYWQVVDQGNRDGNYLETSGSAMIAYGMLKGARLGVLSEEYRKLGLSTFDGLYDRYLSLNESDGQLNLKGICLVAGLGPENDLRRDGSYEYYISEPVVENDAKGAAPFLMCYTEVKQ